MGDFGLRDEPFLEINYTGTDNQTQNNQKNTQKNRKVTNIKKN